jgi:predicted nuclease of restriction endonuclease-like (RecB) superfamily
MIDKYYNEIKNNFIDDEIYSKVKDYSKEKHRVETYYKNGKLLNDAGNHYGENIIKEYSKNLIKEVNKKYNERTLRRMRQFYRKFCNVKWSTMSTKLSWSHYTELLPIKNEDEMMYYYNLCINQSIDVRSLRKKIKSKEFDRLPSDTINKLIVNDKIDIKDLVPNPVLIENKSNKEILSEKGLHHLIIENIADFLEELGNGFSFIKSEYPIKIDDRYNYIDILLYNVQYHCYVVVELKVTELKKEHIGQIQVYMNYINENIESIEDNDTIGIIICKEDNQYIIRFCSDNRIITRTYLLI